MIRLNTSIILLLKKDSIDSEDLFINAIDNLIIYLETQKKKEKEQND